MDVGQYGNRKARLLAQNRFFFIAADGNRQIRAARVAQFDISIPFGISAHLLRLFAERNAPPQPNPVEVDGVVDHTRLNRQGAHHRQIAFGHLGT